MPLWKLVVLQCCSRTLYVAGFAVNFLLYTVSGRVFREQLESIVCGRLARRSRAATLATIGGQCRSRADTACAAVTSGHRFSESRGTVNHAIGQHEEEEEEGLTDDMESMTTKSGEHQGLVDETVMSRDTTQVTGEVNISMI